MAERDTQKRFEALADKWSKAIALAWGKSVSDVLRLTDMREFIAAVDAGDITRAVDAVGLTTNAMAPLDNAIAATYGAGGAYSLSNLPKIHPGTGAALVVNFAGRHPRAEAWIAREAGGLINNILSDQRAMIAEQIRSGLADGLNPRNVALDIVGRINPVTQRRAGGLIGLAQNEAVYVKNLRRDLADPNKLMEYFTRSARDRRFDAKIRRAAADGRALTRTEIDKISGRYADRLLKLRGDRIARTEAQSALNAGRTEGLNQLVDTGAVDARDVTKAWSDTSDGRERKTHAGMDGQSVPINEPFASPSGARLMHPGDTSQGAPADEVINCRCWMAQRVDWLRGAA